MYGISLTTGLAILCASFVLAFGSVHAQVPRPVTFDDLDGVRHDNETFFVTLDLSPDGKYLAIGRGRALQVLDTDTGRVLHDLGEGRLPRWSPSGDRLAFYSIRSGAMQLWTWDADNGQVQQLTDLQAGVDPDPTTRILSPAIEAFDYAWSPDGTRLVFASRVAFPLPGWDGKAPLVLDRTTPSELTLSGVFTHPGGLAGGIAESPDGKQWLYRASKRGEVLLSRLFVVDVETRTAAMLDGQSGNLFHPQWSPDGRWIAFAVIDESSSDIFSVSHSEIRVRDTIGGTESVVASGAGIRYRPRWSGDGKAIAYLSGRAKPDIEMVTLDGKSRRTHAFGKHVWKHEWARDGDGLLLSYSEGVEAKLGRLRFGADSLSPLSSGMEGHWSQARDGTLAWMDRFPGPDLWLLRPAAEMPVKLASFTTDDGHEDLRFGRLEIIKYRTAHGFELEGVLLYPPDYRPGRAYPLIVDGYPNGRGTRWMNPARWMHPMMGNQAWAASGYLVFKPYARSPHTWSNCFDDDPEFCKSGRGPQGWDIMVDDVMSGVDALIRRGVVDPARMCVYGFSNGGGLVSHLVTRTDRFRCAVIVAPVWPSWIGSPLLSPQTWKMMLDWTGVDVLADPDAYMKLSSVFRAKEVETPVLLAAGDKDGGFLLGAIEMYNALRFAGADVTLLRYPDQAHLFKGDGLRDLWQRQMAFFDRHLKPDQESGHRETREREGG